MKVWIVTEGEYSEYQIVAVFETKDEAEAFCGGCDDHIERIEEWETGIPHDIEPYRQQWWVEISIQTGDLVKEYEDCVRERSNFSTSYTRENFYTREETSVGKSTISREHALKVAAERRQAYLRENSGQAAK